MCLILYFLLFINVSSLGFLINYEIRRGMGREYQQKMSKTDIQWEKGSFSLIFYYEVQLINIFLMGGELIKVFLSLWVALKSSDGTL